MPFAKQMFDAETAIVSKMETVQAPFFSIVVPCCNVGKYVDEMVESIRSQSFTNWECILSVERSDDDTHEKCLAAARQDARFSVLFGERSGSASVPRNRGLVAAKGRYVVWVDGDDRLAEGALARLADDVRKADNPDLIQFAAEERDECGDDESGDVQCIFNFEEVMDGCSLTGEETMIAIADHPGIYYPVPWLMCIRIDFLRKNDLSFIPGVRYEDAEWAPRVLYAARNVFVDKTVCYFYRRRTGSVTTIVYSKRNFMDFVEVARSWFRFHAEHSFSDRLSRAWARSILSLFLEYFFKAKRISGIRKSDWTKGARALWKEGGRGNFLRLVRFAGLPKRLAAPLVLLCGIHPLLDAPARAYFRFLYYPLVMWQVRRRGR